MRLGCGYGVQETHLVAIDRWNETDLIVSKSMTFDHKKLGANIFGNIKIFF